MEQSTRRTIGTYLIALSTVAIAVAVTSLTWPLSESSTWAFFFAAVMTTAWYGDLGPCLLATFLSALVGTYFFTQPYYTFQLTSTTTGPALVFMLVSIFISFLSVYRRELQEKKRMSRPWFEGTVTSIAEGVVTTDVEGRVTFLNRIAEQLSGWTLGEAKGKPLRDVLVLVNERTREHLANPVAEVLATGRLQGVTNHTILIARNGTELPIEDSAAPLKDGADRTVGVLLVFRDVSERIRAAEALRKSEELNRKIIDGSDDCLRVLDLEGRMLSVNEHGCKLMEIDDFEPFRGQDWSIFWPEATRGTAKDAVERASRGERVSLVGFCPTAKGTPKWWEVFLAPILDAAGEPERLLCVSRDITERKRTEDELRASEERYRTLFNSIDEGFCVAKMIFDDQGRPRDCRFLEVNPAFEGHTGLGNAAGRTLRELAPDCDDYWFEILGKVALTGEAVRFVNRVPALDNRWFDLYAFRLGNEHSRKVALIFTNVSEAVRAEEERERLVRILKNERSNLARLVEKAPAFICTLRGPNHVFELANAQYYDLVGRREVIGRTVAEVLPEIEGQGYIELLDKVYRTGKEFVGKEMSILLRRGASGPLEKRFVNFVYQAMIEPEGEVSGIFVHGVDVTDMVAASEAVKESEAQFRQLADAMPQAVWTASPDGEIDYCNRKWYEYSSVPGRGVADVDWLTVVHPDDVERTRETWLKSLRTGQPFEMEFRFKRASDGAYRWHLSRALPIKDSSGEVVRWIGTNTDIDDAKRISETLQQADRRKDEFLATLAHELRNPLAPIRAGLQILRMKPDEEMVSSTLDMMFRQLGHMVHLIDDLMDVARVSSGKITLRKQRVTLQSVVESALEASRQAIEADRHELTVKLPDERIYLEVDPTRISQVVANLLNNAAKYTEPGGRIEISAYREGGAAVVRVKDTGVGIAPGMLSKIFDMFTQVGESIDRSQGGLGIGLTIVRRLVEMHGGRIEARSEGVGRGSEFIVHLPMADSALAVVEPPSILHGDGDGDGNGEKTGNLRVLVVDDNRDSANSLTKLLSLAGYDVHTVYDGEQALVEAESFLPNVVLLDIGLPGRNGYEVAALIRENPALRNTKLIALTGWGQAEDRRRSREAGFDFHFVKPVDLNALYALLEANAKLEAAGHVEVPAENNEPGS